MSVHALTVAPWSQRRSANSASDAAGHSPPRPRRRSRASLIRRRAKTADVPDGRSIRIGPRLRCGAAAQLDGGGRDLGVGAFHRVGLPTTFYAGSDTAIIGMRFRVARASPIIARLDAASTAPGAGVVHRPASVVCSARQQVCPRVISRELEAKVAGDGTNATCAHRTAHHSDRIACTPRIPAPALHLHRHGRPRAGAVTPWRCACGAEPATWMANGGTVRGEGRTNGLERRWRLAAPLAAVLRRPGWLEERRAAGGWPCPVPLGY